MSSTYIIGQTILLIDTLTDPLTSTLIDDSSEAVTVYQPDSAAVTPAVTHVSLGVYTAEYDAVQAGWHEYVWRSTGAASGASRGTFYVSPVP